MTTIAVAVLGAGARGVAYGNYLLRNPYEGPEEARLTGTVVDMTAYEERLRARVG